MVENELPYYIDLYFQLLNNDLIQVTVYLTKGLMEQPDASACRIP